MKKANVVLKPCPFCGCKARILRDSYDGDLNFAVGCPSKRCKMTPCTSYRLSLDEVVKVWNFRQKVKTK